MHTLARKRIQVCRQSCNKRLTFTCCHLCNTPLMQGNSAQNLHIKMAHFQNSVRCFTTNGISLWKHVHKVFTCLITFFEILCAVFEFFVTIIFVFFFQSDNFVCNLFQFFDLCFVFVSKKSHCNLN